MSTQPINLSNEQAKAMLLSQVTQAISAVIVRVETIFSDLINQIASQQDTIAKLTKENEALKIENVSLKEATEKKAGK